jgi:hypothetical protein
MANPVPMSMGTTMTRTMTPNTGFAASRTATPGEITKSGWRTKLRVVD